MDYRVDSFKNADLNTYKRGDLAAIARESILALDRPWHE